MRGLPLLNRMGQSRLAGLHIWVSGDCSQLVIKITSRAIARLAAPSVVIRVYLAAVILPQSPDSLAKRNAILMLSVSTKGTNKIVRIASKKGSANREENVNNERVRDEKMQEVNGRLKVSVLTLVETLTMLMLLGCSKKDANAAMLGVSVMLGVSF